MTTLDLKMVISSVKHLMAVRIATTMTAINCQAILTTVVGSAMATSVCGKTESVAL